jgi:hypothetical protein
MGGYDKTGCLKDYEAYGNYWNGGATDIRKKNSCCWATSIRAVDETNAAYKALKVTADAATPKITMSVKGEFTSRPYEGSDTVAASGYTLWTTNNVPSKQTTEGISSASEITATGFTMAYYCNSASTIATSVAAVATMYISLA